MVLQEYINSMEYSADFAASRHNLANLYSELEKPDDAVTQYEQAIRIDDRFFPAKVNLAVLYSQRVAKTKRPSACSVKSSGTSPNLYDAAYSLGLLLVEMQNYREAVTYLEKASRGLPERARIRYNLGLLYAHLQNIYGCRKPAACRTGPRTAKPRFSVWTGGFLPEKRHV